MEPQEKINTAGISQTSETTSKESVDTAPYFGKQPPYLLNYYLQIVHLCNLLSIQLLKNNNLISQFLRLKANLPSEGTKSLNSTQYHSDGSKRTDLDYNLNNNVEQDSEIPSKVTSRRKKIKESEEQSYQPDVDDRDESYWAVSESKNMPKNFRKALFFFISKHQKFVTSVCERLNISQQQFAKSAVVYSVKINSIAQLRALWSNSENKLAKAYRIISMQYLRKHSLSYIFNSKVSKYGKHIKYRHTIMQGVRDPENFTSMKQF